MSDQNWVIPTNALEFFSQQDRRIGQEERRPSIRKASDLLGPGIAPYAVPLTDFNSDMAAFNGFFIAEPSTPDLNGGPDNTKWWVGQTIADQFNGGWQMFSTFQAADAVDGRHMLKVRSFALAPDSNTRFYSAWQDIGGGVQLAGPVSATASSPFTTTMTMTRIGSIVFPAGGYTRASGSSTSYTVAGSIPTGYRPAASYGDTKPIFGGAITWGVVIDTGGSVQFRMSAATTAQMTLNIPWVTNDPFP